MEIELKKITDENMKQCFELKSDKRSNVVYSFK